MSAKNQRDLERDAQELLARGVGLARFLMGNASDGEDVLQDAFITAFKKVEEAQPRELWPWFAAIVLNTARNARRKRARRSASELLDQDASMDADPTRSLDQAWISEQLRRAIESLPEKERDAVGLTYLGGLTHKEAADKLGIPRRTLTSRVQLGLEHLRGKLGARWQESFCLAFPLAGTEWGSAPISTLSPISTGASNVSTEVSARLSQQALDLTRAHQQTSAALASKGSAGWKSASTLWMSGALLLLSLGVLLSWLFGVLSTEQLEGNLFGTRESERVEPNQNATDRGEYASPSLKEEASSNGSSATKDSREKAEHGAHSSNPNASANTNAGTAEEPPTLVRVHGRVVEGYGDVESPTPTSTPIPDAKVWCHIYLLDQDKVIARRTRTNQQGEFDLGEYPEGSLAAVYFAHPEFYTDRPFEEPHSGNGDPVIERSLRAWRDGGRRDVNGNFRWIMSPSSHAFSTTHSFQLRSRTAQADQGITLIGVRGYSISGRVTGPNGTRLENGIVVAREGDLGLYLGQGLDSDGRFETGPFAEGSLVTLTAFGDGAHHKSVAIRVRSDQPNVVELQLEASATLFFDLSDLQPPAGQAVSFVLRGKDSVNVFARTLKVDTREPIEIEELALDTPVRMEAYAVPSALPLGQSAWVTPNQMDDNAPVYVAPFPRVSERGVLSEAAAQAANLQEEQGPWRAFLIRGGQLQGDWTKARKWLRWVIDRPEQGVDVTPGEPFSITRTLPGAYQWIVLPRSVAEEIASQNVRAQSWDDAWNAQIFISQRLNTLTGEAPYELSAPVGLGGVELSAPAAAGTQYRVLPADPIDLNLLQFALGRMDFQRMERELQLDQRGSAASGMTLLAGRYIIERQQGEDWVFADECEVRAGETTRIALSERGN